MSELKPCPFCGEREDLQVNDDSDNEGRGGVQYIWCYACNIGGPSAVMPEDVWNARPFEARAVEVLADKLHQIGTTNAYLAGTRYMEYDLWEMATEETKDKYRAEARELLGIKEGE